MFNQKQAVTRTADQGAVRRVFLAGLVVLSMFGAIFGPLLTPGHTIVPTAHASCPDGPYPPGNPNGAGCADPTPTPKH